MTSKRPQLTLIWDSKNQSLMSPQDLPPLLEKTRESVHSQLESIESKEDTDEFYKGKIIRVVLLRHYPYLNPNKKGGQTYDKLEDID